MVDSTADFGALLRRLRVGRGLSLGRLAQLVFYSKGHLSNVEHGHKAPTDRLARLCDNALDARGVLSRHPAVVPGPSEEPAPPALSGAPWALRMAADGSGWWDVADASHRLTAPPRSDHPPLHDQWALFDAVRGIGRAASPSSVLPLALTQFQTVRAGAAGTLGANRRAHLLLSARLAEYLGWMWQEAGDDRAALAWTDDAVALAGEAEDTELTQYAGARRALVMLYRRQAAHVVALTEHVAPTASPRVRWLTALRLAQGHALAGDHVAFQRAIERAHALLDAVTGAGPDPTGLGPATPIDRMAAVVGWGLYDLGRPGEAVSELETALGTMPRHTRDYARFGTRLALAYVACGELARGCALMAQLLDAVVQVDSATIRTDLHVFARIIEKHHLDPVATALRQRLTVALHR